jgi:hypothetical protein
MDGRLRDKIPLVGCGILPDCSPDTVYTHEAVARDSDRSQGKRRAGKGGRDC